MYLSARPFADSGTRFSERATGSQRAILASALSLEGEAQMNQRFGWPQLLAALGGAAAYALAGAGAAAPDRSLPRYVSRGRNETGIICGAKVTVG